MAAEFTTRPASLIIVGEISHTLRAQGNPVGTGVIGTGLDSPVISGKYEEIPQFQIGLVDYGSFGNLTSQFLDDGTDRNPWNVVGANSLDAIFSPYNNLPDSGRVGPYMPYWTAPSGEFGKKANSFTLNPYDPFGQLAVVDTGLATSSPKTNMSFEDDVWFSGGHNISMGLVYHPLDSGVDGSGGYIGETGQYPGGTGSPVDFYFEKDHWARHNIERQGIRGVGLRSPMILTGWGYDINNLPVPARSGNPQYFHPEASWNPHLWKSGPIDLRWDEQRGVWAGHKQRIYLVKMTNLYTPPSFSFEVDRSNTRDQYSRNAPATASGYNPDGTLYDPEYVAYTNNPLANYAYYEQLDYGNNAVYPYYEAFIIRETDDSPVPDQGYYNIWTNDCNDCGHISNSGQCGGEHGTSPTLKRILIENPLRQSFDVGDLAFTVYTGRQQRVNTGSFSGGSGSGASATITTDASGNATFNVVSAGAGYTVGGFAILPATGCYICANITPSFSNGSLDGGIILPSGGFTKNQSCTVTIIPNDASMNTELLPIHWVIQSEFKSQQVVTHVEADNGILQTCTMKIQTQGFKTCEWCGEDTAYINS
jgi:hypothetical protein